MGNKPAPTISSWIKESAKVEEVLLLQAPWHSQGQTVSSVAWVHKQHREKMLKSSGLGEGFCRDFVEKGEAPPEDLKLVPLPLEQDLASAQRTATCFSEEDVFGIVPCSKGYALRVRKEKYGIIPAAVHGESTAKFTGVKYVVRSLPSYWGKGEVRPWLASWGAEPLYHVGQG